MHRRSGARHCPRHERSERSIAHLPPGPRRGTSIPRAWGRNPPLSHARGRTHSTLLVRGRAMSALDGWIDICRAGTWRDMQGHDVRLDEERLDRIVVTHAAARPGAGRDRPSRSRRACLCVDRRAAPRRRPAAGEAPRHRSLLPRGGGGRTLQRPFDRPPGRCVAPRRIPGRPRAGGAGACADPLRSRAGDGGRLHRRWRGRGAGRAARPSPRLSPLPGAGRRRRRRQPRLALCAPGAGRGR